MEFQFQHMSSKLTIGELSLEFGESKKALYLVGSNDNFSDAIFVDGYITYNVRIKTHSDANIKCIEKQKFPIELHMGQIDPSIAV